MGQHARIHGIGLDVQTLGVTPAGARAKPVTAGTGRQAGDFGRQYGFSTLEAHFTRLFAVATPIHFVHACINGRHHLGRAMLAIGSLGQYGQVGDRQDRTLQGKGQALHHTNGDPHPGKGSRPAPEGNGFDG